MIIAVASGKGGTGKTTLSTALAEACDGQVHLIDCDVEEPNCYVFTEKKDSVKRIVYTKVPEVDENRCTGCGKCAEFCMFNALGVAGSSVMVFDELCHNCGGCMMVCPNGAIKERELEIGFVENWDTDSRRFSQGVLKVGNAMSPPVIRSVKEEIGNGGGISILDCPPGTSCPAVEGIKGSDFVILVTEPTPFGLHDLKLAVEMVKELNMDFGVVINRSSKRDLKVDKFCRENNIPVLLKIPESRMIAEAYSKGEGLLSIKPGLKEQLRGLPGYIAERSRE